MEADCRRVFEAGGKPRKIFFGDGNAFTFDADYLLKLLSMVKRYFPDVEMINMDATVTSVLEKTDTELKRLYDAGVRHLYLGIETGLDDVLRFMRKDHTLDEAYEAIERLQRAGFIYDAHIMTGVAGQGRGEENARALAAFFARTNPAHVVNFSMFLQDGVPLHEDIVNGAFVPATETENLEEDRILVQETAALCKQEIRYDSFHDYIAYRVRGTLPRDTEKMIVSLDQKIAEEKAEEARTKQPLYADVFGTCPALFDKDSGRYIWDTARSA